MLEPVAEHLDGAALVDLTAEPGQEAAAGRSILHRVLNDSAFLGLSSTFRKALQVEPGRRSTRGRSRGDCRSSNRHRRSRWEARLPYPCTRGIARVAGQGGTDQLLEAPFGGVGGYASTPSAIASSSSASSVAGSRVSSESASVSRGSTSGKSGCCLADVEFAGHYIGDEAGAVFASGGSTWRSEHCRSAITS